MRCGVCGFLVRCKTDSLDCGVGVGLCFEFLDCVLSSADEKILSFELFSGLEPIIVGIEGLLDDAHVSIFESPSNSKDEVSGVIDVHNLGLWLGVFLEVSVSGFSRSMNKLRRKMTRWRQKSTPIGDFFGSNPIFVLCFLGFRLRLGNGKCGIARIWFGYGSDIAHIRVSVSH